MRLLLIFILFWLSIEARFAPRLLPNNDICRERNSDFYFRLSDTDCRHVVRCSNGELLPMRCPPGLAFDIERQTCDWKFNVENCGQLERNTKPMPLLTTDEPICEPGKIACGNGDCLPREYFCDGIEHCTDGSDENACTADLDPNGASPCDPSLCILPACFCSNDGTLIPGGIEPSNAPQMVLISFDDAVNNNNIDIYQYLFNGERRNPNGCQIKGTFFVSHKYTNYSAVQDLARLGHEIAVHSITHMTNESYWNNADTEIWRKEMSGARKIIERFANLTEEDVVGMRSPFLRIGSNQQFSMMSSEHFQFDSTMTAPISEKPLWPYTLDYRMPHKCIGNRQRCPTKSYPGLWEIVMNELDRREDPEFDEPLSGCAMIDSCGNIANDKQFAGLLKNNFNRHYFTNRAPFGLFFHASWLSANPSFLEILTQWIDEILGKGDVYFVTMSQAIKWMQVPTPVQALRDFSAWKDKCDVKGQPFCSIPNDCPLATRELPTENLRLQTCIQCPRTYPWIENTSGD